MFKSMFKARHGTLAINKIYHIFQLDGSLTVMLSEEKKAATTLLLQLVVFEEATALKALLMLLFLLPCKTCAKRDEGIFVTS